MKVEWQSGADQYFINVPVNQSVTITENGTLISIGEKKTETPNGFELKQNYPNPFNPSTKINYELRVTNYVSLKVYDVLGNEVSDLVAQKQNAGFYEIDFDGNNLAGGVYYYTLKIDGYSETKKMVLLK